MRYIKLFEEFNERIIFIRTKNFDNTGTIRKLPYDGIQCWCISEDDLDKYIEELELWGGNRNNVEIINPTGYDIYAINYPETHKYVMGEIDKLPELEMFDEKKHRMKYLERGVKSILKYVSELGANELCYQIILKSI
jgi:hypothetical protein